MGRTRTSLLALATVLLALVHGAVAFAAPTFGTPGPDAIPTFQSIGLYWAPPQASSTNVATVQFRPVGTAAWRPGLDLWFDARTSPAGPEYRGSIVELASATTYEIQLTLKTPQGAVLFTETLQAATWSETETLPVPAGYQIKLPPPPGGLTISRIVLNPASIPAPTTSLSGRELTINVPSADSGTGYTLITADPGNQVVDPTGTAALPGNAFDNQVDSCILINHGVKRVIIRGLELRNCRRHGVFLWRNLSSTTQTRDIVIEDNLFTGWGSFGRAKAGFPDNDGAVGCATPGVALNLRPVRIIVQRNTMSNARHNATPWGPNHIHPEGPQGIVWGSCGRNHVIRWNDIVGVDGQKHFMDGIGGGENFSTEGFPWADSDINGNKITHVYDDAIEAEGGNRNVRIWGNYLDKTMVAIANAATSVGPLYVWRNVSNDMALFFDPSATDEGIDTRGPFVKAGSNSANSAINGGRAYYFHNTLLQPPSQQSQPYPRGAGYGLNDSGGSLPFYNFVSLNNIWHIHKVPQLPNANDYRSIEADCNVQGPCTADYDLFNGLMVNPGPNPEIHGFGNPVNGDENSVPTYASSGGRYPAPSALPSASNEWSGDFQLASSSRGFHGGIFLANFNDLLNPDPGAHQSGTARMKFGVAAAMPPTPPPPPPPSGPTARLAATPLSGAAPLTVSFDATGSTAGGSAITTYSIDFGDGSPSGTGATQSHTYGTTGNFTATLTVTDANGLQSTDAKAIQVTVPEGPPFSGASAFRLFVSANPGLTINRAAGEKIDFSVSAADGRALQKVRFFVDGAHKLTDSATPFQFSWTPAASDSVGSHTLLAEATDTAGNVAVETRTLTLLASACSIFVSATSVTQGEPIDVQGVCTTTQTLERMEFFVDNVLQSPNRDATPPYTWTMDTSAFAVGTRVLRIRGVQGSVVIGEDSVSIQILAAPLTLTFSPGTVVQRTEDLTVTVSATDGRALKQVDFYFDGIFRAGENMAPFQFTWPAGGSSRRPDVLGRRLLVVQATDSNGNVLTATRDLYVLTQTCNVLLATSQFEVSSPDTVLVAPHAIVQGQPLVVHGLCSASQSVTQIDVLIDGVQQSSDTIAPYGWALGTSSLAPGTHTLAIRALLAGGTQSNHSMTFEVLAPLP
jgi:PKD repeat protein